MQTKVDQLTNNLQSRVDKLQDQILKLRSNDLPKPTAPTTSDRGYLYSQIVRTYKHSRTVEIF